MRYKTQKSNQFRETERKWENNKMKLQGLFLVAIFSLAYMQLAKGQPQPRGNCPIRCGNVTIEYPFGISSGCYYPEDHSFNITCKEEKLIFGDMQVINILHSGELRVLKPTSFSCYNNNSSSTVL